ncbi:hypothetical protein Pint_19141 [Pistacia integerrima]|uniref:Uncharacterized protein n=1 Tax=Pistacia integerrima TaxID=434235 RepID=A0ACC0YXJ0_9ROSI|nr:hypothetical protein Pint_19141 [Pistacia integerrima]
MGHLTPFLRLARLLASCNVKVTFITPEPTVSLAESQISPPLSALVTDMSLTAAVVPITEALKIPNFIFFTSSAKMLTLFVSFHTLAGSKDYIKIPTLEPIPRSWIPPSLLQDTNNLLKTYIIENGKSTTKSDGILVNTLESIEQSSLLALNGGKVIEGLPLVTAIGLLPPLYFEDHQPLAWLDDQPAGSVVYVSFGSRTAITREQLRELGNGLPAVGGFLSHCGWNSVTEAMWHGVHVLAWPQHGDQKINADLVERIGLGTWEKSWSWGGGEIVMREQIAEKIKEVMGNKLLRSQAMRIREEARNGIELGGGSKKGLTELIKMLKKERS